MKSIVVALGGNALGNSPKEQLEAVKGSSKSLADIVETYDKVAVIHGNGPQVGVINLALSLAAKEDSTIPEFPLVECVSMSQGYIGYHLQQAIENELASRNIDKKVATVVTQVEVDPKGVDAVIDKDFVASRISSDIGADTLLILTAVDSVYINFGKENQEELREITVSEIKKHIEDNQFHAGSMLPKVEACIKFIEENPEGTAIITSLEKAAYALSGEVGTKIING